MATQKNISSEPDVNGHSVREVVGEPGAVGIPEGGLPEEFRKQIGDNKNVPWYKKDLGVIDEQARELLEKYSKIPADKVNRHILDLVRSPWRSIISCPNLNSSKSEMPVFPRSNFLYNETHVN